MYINNYTLFSVNVDVGFVCFRMLDRDVGEYEAVATNEHGEARQRVKLEIAEYPEFIKRPEETIIMTRRSGRIEARVIGVPYPEIKWYKDWQPIASSSRIKVRRCASVSDVVPNGEFIRLQAYLAPCYSGLCSLQYEELIFLYSVSYFLFYFLRLYLVTAIKHIQEL